MGLLNEDSLVAECFCNYQLEPMGDGVDHPTMGGLDVHLHLLLDFDSSKQKKLTN